MYNISYWSFEGYMFGGLLFKIDLCNLFLIMNRQDVANHVDDNTPNVRGKNIGEIVTLLEVTSCVVSKCLSGISFQRNDLKCQFVIKSWQIHTSKYRHHTNWKQQVWKVTARGDYWKTERWKSELRSSHKSKVKTKGFCKGCFFYEKREIIYLCKHF